MDKIKIAVGTPAVFLDRDGVLAKEKGYVTSVSELEIFSYARKCVADIKAKGYLAIVVTNQSGVARGFFSEKELKRINEYFIGETGVDALYYCPHYEKGIIPAYTRKCNCRKPQIGMIEAACRDFQINLAASYMVGDRAGDILFGQRAGLTTVLLESGYGTAGLEMEVTPDYILDDLRDVVEIISQLCE